VQEQLVVLIEYLVLKLALGGISEEVNHESHLRELVRKQRKFKSQLSQLAIDYTMGIIDKETYEKRESAIKSELVKMSKQT
jgi:hypothetical protein